jgi:putative MATE family efflux protein
VTDTPLSNEQQETKGVKTLLGDPKKAIIKLAIPMIIAMFIQTSYNFVDALWVSGFGADLFTTVEIAETGKLALAAIGFVSPFYMMAIAISTGLGVGSSSAISRRIGSKDKKGADNIATHSIILTLIVAVFFTIILYSLAEQILAGVGAGESLQMATEYGKIIFAGSIIIFFINMATAILRGEGDVKKVLYALMIGTVLNIILDPIFIFTFKMGIAGAAYATILSMIITAFILAYWLFFRKNTYINFKFKNFKFKSEALYDIFKVGLPASFQQLTMSIMMIILNIIIVKIALGGDAGVAVYSTGWRIVTIAVLPLLGLATAVTSVTGATFGAKEYKKLNESYIYSLKFGLLMEVILAIFIFLLAPFITIIFTTGQGSEKIALDLENFIKISVLFYPGAAFGIVSSALFQGVGKGFYALIVTSLRTVILIPLLAVVFCCFFSLGLNGIWWGLVVANIVGSMIAFLVGKSYVNKLLMTKKSDNKQLRTIF